MNTHELCEKIPLKPLCQSAPRNISGVYISDMISEVMAGCHPDNLWLTVQTHKSIVPAANLVDVAAIIITNGKEIPQETLDLATKHDIAILTTEIPTYELVGKLYELGIRN